MKCPSFKNISYHIPASVAFPMQLARIQGGEASALEPHSRVFTTLQPRLLAWPGRECLSAPGAPSMATVITPRCGPSRTCRRSMAGQAPVLPASDPAYSPGPLLRASPSLQLPPAGRADPTCVCFIPFPLPELVYRAHTLHPCPVDTLPPPGSAH